MKNFPCSSRFTLRNLSSIVLLPSVATRRGRRSGDRYLLPLFCPCGFQHCVGYEIGSQAVPKGWGSRAILGEGEKEIGTLVNEGVFVADLQSRNPPVFHVWMVSVGDVNTLPPAQVALIAV